MNLVDALAQLRPVPAGADGPEQLRLRSAARLLLAALRDVALYELPANRFSASDRDNVIQDVLYRLLRAGPRGQRHGDPTDDSGVRRWLRRAVRNGRNDRWRRQRHETTVESGAYRRALDHAALAQPTTQPQHLARARALLAAAREHLEDHMLPAIAAMKEHRSPGAGERFSANIGELRQAVLQGVPVSALVERGLQAEGGAVTAARSRSRRAALDKRFQRLREPILAAIEADHTAGVIDTDMRSALLVLVRTELYLQERSDALVHRPRRARPDSGGFSA